MHHVKNTLTLFFCFLLFAGHVFAADGKKEFDAEKMMAELQQKLELSREQWEKLKPVLDQKSRELQQSMHESIDKGYAEFEKLSEQLDTMSKDAEKKAQEMLSSEEVQKFRDYLSKIDEDAIKEAKDRMVADLTKILQLTEEQAAKIKPVLEESMNQLSTMFSELAQEGSKNWERFSKEFEQMTRDLKDKLQETLDNEQMKKLEEYNRQQKEKIQKVVFTA